MIPQWLQEFARGRTVIFAFILWLIFSILLFQFTSYRTLQAANGNQPLLEERFGYTTEQVKQQMQSLGDWRESYRNFQILDYLNAILMALALTLGLTFTLTRLFLPGNPLRSLFILPVLVALGEFIENTVLILLSSSYPDLPPTLVSIASRATVLKLSLAFFILPLVVLSFIAAGIKSIFNYRLRQQRER